jgi:hypothetical protein
LSQQRPLELEIGAAPPQTSFSLTDHAWMTGSWGT